MDAIIWGGRSLDAPHTDRDEAAATVAEGLLDRIGAVLSRMTGYAVQVQDGVITLSGPAGPVSSYRWAGAGISPAEVPTPAITDPASGSDAPAGGDLR
jgi:hypothetical protein